MFMSNDQYDYFSIQDGDRMAQQLLLLKNRNKMKSFVSLQNRTKASLKYKTTTTTTTTTTKIVHEYDEKHPLISIEERSKANPYRPF
jgi:ethanolamine utilization protein EutA (predicted chaperonin)